MSMEIEIGEARAAEELAVVRELFEEYERGLGIDLDFQRFDVELDSLPGEYASPRGHLLLARAGDEAVACGGFRPHRDDACELKRVYVREARRGHGLGRRITELLVAEAGRAGYRRMRLDTLGRLSTANALYESMGFVEIPPYRDNPHDDAIYLELEL